MENIDYQKYNQLINKNINTKIGYTTVIIETLNKGFIAGATLNGKKINFYESENNLTACIPL